jgi:hypothetical protein
LLIRVAELSRERGVAVRFMATCIRSMHDKLDGMAVMHPLEHPFISCDLLVLYECLVFCESKTVKIENSKQISRSFESWKKSFKAGTVETAEERSVLSNIYAHQHSAVVKTSLMLTSLPRSLYGSIETGSATQH